MLQYMSMLSESVIILKMNWLLYWLSFGVSFAGAYLGLLLAGIQDAKV